MARKLRRLSDESASVVRLFVDEPQVERYGLEIIRDAGIKSGSMYPILHRFEDRRILLARWDVEAAEGERRRPRRLYRLNPEQAKLVEDLYAEWCDAKRGHGASAPRLREAL